MFDRVWRRALCRALGADPDIVIALVVGIALNPAAERPSMQPGMAFCVRAVLCWAVALLGLCAPRSARSLLYVARPPRSPARVCMLGARPIAPKAVLVDQI